MDIYDRLQVTLSWYCEAGIEHAVIVVVCTVGLRQPLVYWCFFG